MSVSGEAVKCFMKLLGYFEGDCSFIGTFIKWISKIKGFSGETFRIERKTFETIGFVKSYRSCAQFSAWNFQDILIQ